MSRIMPAMETGLSSRSANRAFKAATQLPARTSCVSRSSLPSTSSLTAGSPQDIVVDRRQLLAGASLAGFALAGPLSPAAQAAKAPKGFVAVTDSNDNYQFLYPFGWQEVAVKGTDIVYKDVIEPLESVSVTLSFTDRADITEFGPVVEVCDALAKEVLSAPGTNVNIINTLERKDEKGHTYYQVEFTADTGRYVRHQLAVVGISGGNFYTLTTGANERRWGKMKSNLDTVAKSFQFIN